MISVGNVKYGGDNGIGLSGRVVRWRYAVMKLELSMGVGMLGTVPIILVISDTCVLWYPFVILHLCNEAKATGG